MKDELDNDIETLDLSESKSLSFEDIYEKVIEHEDIIFTIGPLSIDPLKKGLIKIKNKFNAKLLEEGLPVDDKKLKFTVYNSKETPGAIDFRVTLKEPEKSKGIDILGVKLPDDEF